MTSSDTLRLDRLSLTNFRCFANCEIELHPKLTVLVAENAQGKTAILDAIGIALGLFVDSLVGVRQSRGFEASDARLVRGERGTMEPTFPVELTAEGLVNGAHIRWKRARGSDSKYAHTTTRDAAHLRHAALTMKDGLDRESEPDTMPIVAYYGTDRLWDEAASTGSRRLWDRRFDGRREAYYGYLSAFSGFGRFVEWYRSQFGTSGKGLASAYPRDEKPWQLVAAVENAVRTVLAPTGWQRLLWAGPTGMEEEFVGLGRLTVEHAEHGGIPLSMLSDGVRNMVALVGQLAYRCIRLNSHLRGSAVRLTPGILLIDEVDMHLHPRWQQLVVELLQNAFPSMQVILSTHSPHVLSAVDVESIRVVHVDGGRGDLHAPTFQTRGVESADVLTNIMGVDPVPQVEPARWVRDYRALIEDGRAETEEGMELRRNLLEHFGPKHPLMLDCDRLLRFQAFKLRRAQRGEEG